MNKSILLIGGAGYIGPVIAEKLLGDGHKVTILDNLIYDSRFAMDKLWHSSDFRFIKGNMGDKEALLRSLNGVEVVVLLAGLVGDPITKKYPEFSKLTNDIHLQSCIKFLAEMSLNQVIFVSTCSNYGLIPDNVIADENYPTSPLSSYAKSKVEAEELVLKLGSKSHFSPTILRFATAFGLAPRMRFDLSVNEFTKEMYLGKKVSIFDPDTWRPYCHVKDFAQIIKLVIDAPKEIVVNQVFNAGSEINNCTKRQLVDLIAEQVPDPKIDFKENGSDARNYRVDFSKIRETLKFIPQFTLKMGITEIISGIDQGNFDFNSGDINRFGNYSVETP